MRIHRMKKIVFFTLALMVSFLAYGQGDTLQNTAGGADSIAHAHAEFSAAKQMSNVTKAEGDSAYMRNDFAAAIEIYEALLQNGEAPEVYYNLGNSYYKSGDIARAILNYERALLLAPGNADIRANLEVARAKTIDKVTPVPEIFFVAWTKSLINCLSVDAWAKYGIAFFLLLLVSLALFFFSKQVRWKKAGFICGLVCLVFTIVCNVFAAQQKSALTQRNKAIIVAPSVTVRSTPSESGTSLFVLHEGCKVEIKDNTMHEWKEITLEDGKVGWVPASDIEVI